MPLIAIDSTVENLLKGRAIKKGIESGVLIGVKSENAYNVLYSAPTTPHEEEALHEPLESKASPKRRKNPKTPVDFFDKGWIAEHAKQVIRMLPGGVTILGVYIVTKEDPFASPIPVRQTIGAITKAVDEAHLDMIKLEIDPIVIHVHASSGKFTGKILEFLSRNLKPVDLILKPDCGLNWVVLESKLLLKLNLPVTSSESKVTLRKQIQDALTIYFKAAKNATVIFDNQFKDDSELLVPKSQKSKRKHAADEEEVAKSMNVALLFPYPEMPSFALEPCVGMIRLTGMMTIRALVNSKVSVKEAKEAIFEDILRSLWSRCDLHCDSLIGEEQRGPLDSKPVIHEPPRRVIVQLKSPLFISDYLFPGETVKESLPSIGEPFDLYLTEDDVDDTYERPAAMEDFMSHSANDTIEPDENPALQSLSNATPVLSPILLPLGVAVAFVAIAISYILLQQDESL